MIVVAALQNRGARGWDRNTMSDTAAGLEARELRMSREELPGTRRPNTAPVHYAPFFGGIKQSLERIVNARMIPVPRGPRKIIASRPAAHPTGGPAVMPIRAAVVSTALVGVEQQAPFYEFLY